ncbi:SIS domain-containing protein [Streptacidiphilus cavernicola]|uniref:SIS domain-containing protein n=1 Tax=Streptacidiphilus cavernicola TaxID=3342716 RepID=A0ABV6VT36_9ACTN
MIEEWVLDDPEALARADTSEVLLDLASAGATVRNAVRLAGEAGLDRLRPEGRPRAVLVAGHGCAALAGDAFAALVGGVCPVAVLRPNTADDSVTRAIDFTSGLLWSVPGWAGPSDLLVVLSTSGAEPGLVSLIEQAYARGCTVVVVAPVGSALSEAALQTRGLPLPYVSAVLGDERIGRDRDLPRDTPTSFWGLLAPAAALAHRIGLITTPSSLLAAADRLDEVAVRCRPGAETYGNPAKTLAVQLDGVLPLLWSDGPCTEIAARRFAQMLVDQAGRPALQGTLPEALITQRGLLDGQLVGDADDDQDDFFRDRTEEPEGLRLKVLLMHRAGEPSDQADPRPGDGYPDAPSEPRPSYDPGPGPGLTAGSAPDPAPGPQTSRRTLARARALAEDHRTNLSELTSGHADALETIAELVALTDFAAAYLGLASSGLAGVPAGATPLDN